LKRKREVRLVVKGRGQKSRTHTLDLLEDANARQEERTREECKAIRGSQGQRHVQGTSRQDREFSGRIEARRPEITQRQRQVIAGWHHRTAQGRGPQGRKSHRGQTLK